MAARRPRYSKEEFARRGTEIYERSIRAQVEADNIDKIVAINIETGEYALGEDILSAAQILFANDADAQVWSIRVGFRTLGHIRHAAHSE